MIFKFLILSDEVDNFKREIKIDSDATFMDFYRAILDCTGFSEKEMASFFLCDEKWRRKQEITLVEMDTYSDEDAYTMEECILNDFLEDEKQKLMFVFDYLNDRALYIELSEIIPGKNLKAATCTLSIGNAPDQSIDVEDIKAETVTLDMGETFYGDENYDLDELDSEGFDGLDVEPPADLDQSDLF
ncbi:MAG: plasmid pRiA4b ORF-3 family protein [Bacteroidales bacterium]|nr:plasmid pRiA4b ORF-3 family protein [Bacteroidales bacterium]